MKYLFSIILLCVSLLAFSQQKESISSGYITFNSGTTIEFKNLFIEGETVTCISGNEGRETKISKAGVKKIVDNTGAIIYENGKVDQAVYDNKAAVPVMSKQENEKLVYKSSYRILQDGKKLTSKETEALMKTAGLSDLYMKGKSTAEIGDVLMGGGLGFLVGTVTYRLIKINNGTEEKWGPAELIAGAAIFTIGIPIKISGTKKIKAAIRQYNNMPPKDLVSGAPELKIIGGTGGVGFQLRF